MAHSTGEVIYNRYRIVKLLGQGGFGAVYRAWDLNLQRPCALKQNLDSSPEAARQFEREALILANLSHPNLPRVSNHFSIPEQGQFLVMDYVDGEDLQAMQERLGGALPEAQVLPWIRQVCDALDYLHRQRPPVIHRDIKPANIKVTPEGNAMLVDFGIAKVYDPISRTTRGAQAVTPGFSPPEQYGFGSTDPRSDVYALGATMYALLTGMDLPESVEIMSGGAPPPLPAQMVNPRLSATIDVALQRAMQTDRSRRFASAAAFKRALEPGQPNIAPAVPYPAVSAPVYSAPAQPEIAQPVDEAYSVEPQTPEAVGGGRRRLWIGVVIGLILCGLCVVVGFWLYGILIPPVVPIIPATATQEIAISPTSPAVDTGSPTDTPFVAEVTRLANPTEAILTPTQVPPLPTATFIPTATSNSIPVARITNFFICRESCRSDGGNAVSTLPEGVTRFFIRWQFENIPVGTHYVRRWVNRDQEWVRYDCTWPEPESGVADLDIREPNGFRSGIWEVIISLEGEEIFRSEVFIEGNHEFWDPAGTFTTCQDTR